MLRINDSDPLRIGFVGAGMMGGAMIKGLVKAGTVACSSVCVSDVSEDRLKELTVACTGLVTTTTNKTVGEQSDMIVLAVEPKDTPKICAELSAASNSEEKVYVSLAAGVTLESLESWLPRGAKIARVMPNTPCVVGEMAAGYICNAACSLPGKGNMKFLAAPLIGSVLGALGSALEVHEESDLDAVTGVSGSGPAYVFQFIEALSDGGVRCGLSRAVATELAAKCVRGAATMVLQSGKHPGALKDEVTSPGGTTIAAVHALEMGGMRAAVMNAVVVSDPARALRRTA